MIHNVVHLKDYFPKLGENDCDPTLALYLLDNMSCMGRQDEMRPVILICPGGGYADVSQRESEPIAMQFTAKGYNAVVLTYSCAPNRFPTQLREVAAAMELIHTNADNWHCDPSRVAILGFSAGGHLAGQYSTCFDCAEVREMFPDSKAVKASVLCYPVITAYPPHRHLGSFVNLTGHKELTDADMEKFSLEKLVTAQTPPTFLWHTAEDKGVSPMNSIMYAQALAEKNVPFALHIYPFGYHGLSTVDEQTLNEVDDKTRLAGAWIDEALKWLKFTL